MLVIYAQLLEQQGQLSIDYFRQAPQFDHLGSLRPLRQHMGVLFLYGGCTEATGILLLLLSLRLQLQLRSP